VEPVGVVAGGEQQLGGGLHANAVALQQPGRGAPERAGDDRVKAGDLVIQGQPAAKATQGQPQPCGGGKLGAGTSQVELAQRAQPTLQLVVAVDQQRADLVGAWVRALIALRRATTRARSSPTAPLRALGTARASPASTARAAASASTGSLLPLRRRRARSGRLTSTTSMPWSVRCWASR